MNPAAAAQMMNGGATANFGQPGTNPGMNPFYPFGNPYEDLMKKKQDEERKKQEEDAKFLNELLNYNQPNK